MATLPNPLPTLASDPSGRTLGLRLPPGRLIDTTDAGTWHEPLLWCAQQPASAGSWAALGGPAARAGLLPVLVEVSGTHGGPEEWELAPQLASYPGDHDAEEVLAEHWEECEPGDVTDGDSADWPGLAPAPSLTVDPAVAAARLADSFCDGSRPRFEEPRLALVPARRSADVPAAVGWCGPLDHDDDVARLCAVLRSWEDRFHIRVVALGFAVLTVSVAAPPVTLADAEALAAEHYAFCPGNFADRTLREYAKDLVGERAWTFWWD
ncbi:DUF4253 domain-containing protein [Streptomyces sp. NPDC002132]|uniref:DUF4253 domain-containing protein n=1 Tax=unclassified Streptomyces TaxID=2593676 RepID=UPI00331F0DFB